MSFIVIGCENARIQFTMRIPSDQPAPSLIRIKDGRLLSLVGRYASPGDQYCYRLVEITDYDGEISDWPEYSGLKG